MPHNRNAFSRAKLIVLALLSLVAVAAPARAQEPRRISVSVQPTFYRFDSDYFGLEPGFGADVALRYEVVPNIFFENSAGLFRTKGNGVVVDGFDERLVAMAILPGFVSYKAVARLGIGFLSTNPITVTPTQTFRPTQTTFYVVAGAGLARPVYKRFLVDGGVNLWATPYKYRIYTFDRTDVTTRSEAFTQLEVLLSVAYTF